jgi:hypothetical protein
MDKALPAEPAPEPEVAAANPSEPPPVHLAPRPKRKLPQPICKSRAANAARRADPMPALPKAAPKAPARASASSGCTASAAAGGVVLLDFMFFCFVGCSGVSASGVSACNICQHDSTSCWRGPAHAESTQC